VVIFPHNGAFKARNRIHTEACIAEYALGLRWDKSFWKDRFCFGIWGGYEQTIFFGQNQFMNPQYDFTVITTFKGGQNNGPNFFTDRGNLSAAGVTAGIQLGF
jgi:hypothetical protein